MSYFKIANKEVDQDNFIEWIFSLNDSSIPNEKDICRSFLKMLLTNLSDDEKINSIKTKRQFYLKKVGKLDILVAVKTSKKAYLIVIEDKVNANIYNNLNGYEDYIKTNKENVMKRMNLLSNDTEDVFIIIKTGISITNYEMDKVNNSSFVLIDRSEIINCLKRHTYNYLVNDFLCSLDYSEKTKLVEFSKKKSVLCSYIKEKLNCNIDFDSRKYTIILVENEDYKLEINDFSLSSAKIVIKLFGKQLKAITSNYFKLIKKSKCQLIGRAKIEMQESTLGELIEIIKEAIEETLKIVPITKNRLFECCNS